MVDRANREPASTPEAVITQAGTREGSGAGAAAPAPGGCADCPPGEGSEFLVGQGVRRAFLAQPYERQADDPLYRPLWIYTLDPTGSRLEGHVALVNVPYEPLAPGPEGRVLKVDHRNGHTGRQYPRVDLDDPRNLLQDGRAPSPADPQFHQQMVYAVCSMVYATFRKALGRQLTWGFCRGDPARGRHCGEGQLLLCPHGAMERNAYYDKDEGRLSFGYYDDTPDAAGAQDGGGGGGAPPRARHGFVFTCLSHDIVTHEVTHALLDGLRAHFSVPTGRDVLAFHEALGDLVAVFQHFTYDQVVRAAIRQSRGSLRRAGLLTDLARQFGLTLGSDRGLRTAVDVVDPDAPDARRPQYHQVSSEPHELGSLLVSAVFEAFTTVFERKTARYVRLATGGSGVLPPGELPADLQAVLAEEASQLAGQFLSICIRAVDYCPPVDVGFGEYLRAVLTADYELVPDDPWGYREAWFDAFRKRGVYPPDVPHLSEDAMRWRPPEPPVRPVPGLSFADLQFEGDPGRPAGEAELRRQACWLGWFVSRPENLAAFGLSPRPWVTGPGDEDSEGPRPPCVESIRSSRRIGPDGQVVFDLVAEITQRRRVRGGGAGRGAAAAGFDFIGGATVIIGPRGEVRYVIAKRAANDQRLESQRRYMRGDGRRFWQLTPRGLVPTRQAFRLAHAQRGGGNAH